MFPNYSPQNFSNVISLDSSCVEIDGQSYGSQVAELLVRGGNLNATNDQGQTAMHILIASIDPYRHAHLMAPPYVNAALAALLEAGANPNIQDKLGRTPAHLLLTEGWPWEGVGDLFSMLVKGGANLSIADNNGQTPLHYLAAMRGQDPLFFISGIDGIFVGAKVDFQARDKDGNTPLHIAAKTGTHDVFGWLLKQGANMDETNNLGETARLLVTCSEDPFFNLQQVDGDVDIFQIIREGKMDSVRRFFNKYPQLVNIINFHGETPLSLAMTLHQTNIISFLKVHGAK